MLRLDAEIDGHDIHGGLPWVVFQATHSSSGGRAAVLIGARFGV